MLKSQGIYRSDSDVNLDDFAKACEQSITLNDYRFAQAVDKNVVIYDAAQLLKYLKQDKDALLSELHQVIASNGPGVLVIKNMFTDTGIIDDHNHIYEQILQQQSQLQSGADHFAASGVNGRIWNALQKIAEREPELFIDYYKNPLLGLVADAWLGPYWQITSQINVVRPGAKAQQPHRDYHLGFMAKQRCSRFPIAVQKMSTQLTLQGAIAHSDMPIASGPTQLLPFSHQYDLGYLAWRNPEFIDYFKKHCVQLPLTKGDAVFFNPALFHAAGDNHTSDVQRSANLLQISSAFGKTMESINPTKMLEAIYPALTKKYRNLQLSTAQLAALISCCADGYSFPTNLDLDPPTVEMAPETMQDLVHRALQEQWQDKDFQTVLAEKRRQRQA